MAQWQALCAEAAALEAECGPAALRPRTASAAQLNELLAEADGVAEEGSRWLQSMWGELLEVRGRAGALGQNASLGAEPARLEAACRGLGREIDNFRAERLCEFQAAAAEEEELESFLHAWAPRFERWLQEPSALDGELSAGDANSGRWGSCSSLGVSQSLEQQASEQGAPCPASSRTQQALPSEEDLQLRSQLADLDAAVKELGGPTLGWSAPAHEAFLRVFRAYRSEPTPAFYAKATRLLPDKSAEDLAEHVRRFAKYEDVQLQKSRLLAQWRQRRMDTFNEVANAMSAEHEAARRQARSRERRAREERKQRVADWRRMQTDERERCAAEQRSANLEQARLEREQQARRRRQVSDQLDDYRAMREKEQRRACGAEVPAAAGRAASLEARRHCRRRPPSLASARGLRVPAAPDAGRLRAASPAARAPREQTMLTRCTAPPLPKGPFAQQRRPHSAGPRGPAPRATGVAL